MSSYSFQSVIFDLDGVITKTATVHAKAWKRVFDDYMKMRQERDDEPFREFTREKDYLTYVDGKPRYKGVKSFLESRGIEIPYGDPTDRPEDETVCGIGNRKNELFRQILSSEGAEVFDTSVELVRKLKASGVRVGVASSSKNCKIILESVGLHDLFETRVDGVVAAELNLSGKPEGDIFTLAARRVDSEPGMSVVVEDATSGVMAGRNGGFGLVIGVAREGNGEVLLRNGADVAVTDLGDIDCDWMEGWFNRRPRPLFDFLDKRAAVPFTGASVGERDIMVNNAILAPAREMILGKGKTVLFLDYDGTLTPIVERPEMAVISDEMKNTIETLSGKFMVSIVSGRMREDVEKLAGIRDIVYAGSHGFDIRGPDFSMVHPKAEEAVPLVDEIVKKAKEAVSGIEGVIIEEKKFSVAVHYRLVEDKEVSGIEDFVKETAEAYKERLRLMKGKKVFEFLPNIEWDKGQAIRWIMKSIGLSWEKSSVTYMGDDVTDENAFRVVRTRGTGILVSGEPRHSAAVFRLKDPKEVKRLFEELIQLSS